MRFVSIPACAVGAATPLTSAPLGTPATVTCYQKRISGPRPAAAGLAPLGIATVHQSDPTRSGVPALIIMVAILVGVLYVVRIANPSGRRKPLR